jgi:cytochrome c-type biogenesis protein CcmH
VSHRSVLLRAAVLLACVLIALPGLAHAEPMDDAVRRVALQLQCPVCEGQNVADSPSGLARDMRDVIRARLGAGASDAQILDEFVASYGDGILTEPPKRGISLGVWLGPGVGLALGIALLTLVLASWRRAPRVMASPLAPLDHDVADEFRRFRGELGR